MVKRGAKRIRAQGWTEKRTTLFLETLAESCNVRLAAEAAGVSSTEVYRRRAKDASFRADWGRALATGYAALEMMMLRRALHGVERPIDVKNPEAGVMQHYDDRTGIALLKLHQGSAVEADSEVDAQEHDEAIERIMARLQRLKERVTGERVTGDGAVETKSRADRIAILAWALKR